MFTKERRHNNFDFLRLLGAFCITFAHSFNHSYPNYLEPLHDISGGRINFSYIGMGIFFSISGYLILKSAISSSSLKQFFWKRILRIQPLLALACILTVFFLGPYFTTLSLPQYFSNIDTWTYFRTVFPLTGIQYYLPGVFTNYAGESGVNGSLWTLVVEERLYFLLGIIFFLPKFKLVIWYLLVGCINLCYIVNDFFPNTLLSFSNSITLFYEIVFINAGTLYLLKLNFAKNYGKYIIAGLPLLVISLWYSSFVFLQLWILPLLLLSIAQIKGFTNNAGKYGDFSYGIYVFSFPIQQMLVSIKIFKDNPYKLFFVSLVIVIPMAVFSWHFLEKKFLEFKNCIK
jgi:peptidoglycan/LPS O-acetylase OafA/YrhL